MTRARADTHSKRDNSKGLPGPHTPNQALGSASRPDPRKPETEEKGKRNKKKGGRERGGEREVKGCVDGEG